MVITINSLCNEKIEKVLCDISNAICVLEKTENDKYFYTIFGKIKNFDIDGFDLGEKYLAFFEININSSVFYCYFSNGSEFVAYSKRRSFYRSILPEFLKSYEKYFFDKLFSKSFKFQKFQTDNMKYLYFNYDKLGNLASLDSTSIYIICYDRGQYRIIKTYDLEDILSEKLVSGSYFKFLKELGSFSNDLNSGKYKFIRDGKEIE